MENKKINGIIYIATNKLNNKQYVGKTINKLDERIKLHIRCTNKYYFGRSLEKYGIDNFEWKEIKYPIEELDTWEKHWIKELNTKHPTGYNLTDGGDGILGLKHSEKSKIKIAEGALGNTSATNRINKNKILFIDPNGKEFYIENNFNDFCRENNLAIRTVTSHLNGQRSTDNVNDWQIYKLDENGCIIKNKILNTTRIRYCLIDIKTNKEYILEREIEKFCRENKLCYDIVRIHANTFTDDIVYRGYKVYQLDKNGNKIPKTFKKYTKYIFYNENGETIEITEGFNDFCEKKGLGRSSMGRIINGISPKDYFHRGWRCDKVLIDP